MTKIIAVSNRRGGVGKTTTTMMLAYGLSVVGQQKVLVLDLDAQASTSTVIMGHRRLRQARTLDRTIANLIARMYGGHQVNAADYISTGVGDVLMRNHSRPRLDIVAGSHELDDRETELILARAERNHHRSLRELFDHVQTRITSLIRSVEGSYDQVLIDCAPGLSHIVWGALRAADFVIVPYVPDRTAEDNVGWFAKKLDGYGRAGRYRTLPNRVSGERAAGIVRTISARYMPLGMQIPSTKPLADALDFNEVPTSLSVKFGPAARFVNGLLDSALQWINSSTTMAAE